MSKICPKCQTEYDDSHKFCPECGSELAIKEEKPLPQEEFSPKYLKACYATGAQRVKLLQQAAKEGSPDAMYDLACMYYKGEDVEENTETSMKWLKQSADAGYGFAQELLGSAYFVGFECIEQDYNLAEKYLHAAAMKGITGAQNSLVEFYMTFEEYESAVPWLKKTLPLLSLHADTSLAYLYSEGLSVKKNEEEGKRYYRMSQDISLKTKKNLYRDIMASWHCQPELLAEYSKQIDALKEKYGEVNDESSELRTISCTIEAKQPAIPSVDITQVWCETDGNKFLSVNCTFNSHNLMGQQVELSASIEIASQYGKLKNNLIITSIEQTRIEDSWRCTIGNFDFSQIGIPLMKLDETVLYDVTVEAIVNGQTLATEVEEVAVYYKMSMFGKDKMEIR